MAYLLYNWKSVPVTPLRLFHPSPLSLLTTISNRNKLLQLYFVVAIGGDSPGGLRHLWGCFFPGARPRPSQNLRSWYILFFSSDSISPEVSEAIYLPSRNTLSTIQSPQIRGCERMHTDLRGKLKLSKFSKILSVVYIKLSQQLLA